ncbi:flavodoxin [Paenibacillus athensensis]|uniref:Flavodoxin n=1 Tax=Paenibacillus athensensis TaxID=1967502 RepID=A0A4Y8Q948_9BACL|nr:flavodoxin [Paenibacillus athensensis]MCD1257413.1 flavodoxin [Paenibacillus athensensis]
MTQVIVVYASMTGNTEEMAEAVAAGLREAGVEPVLVSVLDAHAAKLQNYDGFLLGAYTWGDGDLPDEFLDFYEELDEVDLQGMKGAVFGSADSSYRHYGAAIRILEEKITERGAVKALEGLKIELSPSPDDLELCKAFGTSFAAQVAVTN